MSLRFSALATLATAALLAAFMGTASAQTSTACGTPPPGYNVIESNARFVIGTTGPDFICAGAGNNIIRAKGKNDIIFGGAGNDIIWGGYGFDMISGGPGDDVITAGGGLDTVNGDAGDDLIRGGTGPDVLRGSDGNDTIIGGDGNDTIRGGRGNDDLSGLRGIDSVWGEADDDSLLGGRANDRLFGGAGDDMINGGAEDDVIGGGDGDDRLRGGEGDDEIVGGNGNDSVVGGGQNDTIRGSDGDDILDGGNGLNSAIGGNGNDTCLNAASPTTDCEIIDGIDQNALPALIVVTYPAPFGATGTIDINGTDWSPAGNIAVNFPLIDGNEQTTPGGPATADGNGDFLVQNDTTSMQGRSVQVVDSTAGRIKNMVPILEGYTYNPTTLELTLEGPTGETFVAFVYNGQDELVHVEQMTFDEQGTITKVLDDFDDVVATIDLRRADDDGDVEMHENAYQLVG